MESRGNNNLQGVVARTALLCSTLLLGTACDDTEKAETSPYRVLRLEGTGIAVETTVADIDGDGVDDDATCFSVPMIDVATGVNVGTATDCLSDIQTVGQGLSLVATTTFKFADGSLVARGQTTVQPVLAGSDGVTHITGAIPSSSTESIIAGTGAYENASGGVRLSGAVNMSRLESDGEIDFDCLFVLPVETPIPAEADRVARVLRLRGLGTATDTTVPDIDGDGIDDPGTCFDVAMTDLALGKNVGTATDCLSLITEAENGETGMHLTATTTFDFGGGTTMVTRGVTTVQPSTIGSPDITHITGAIPDGSENGVISATGDLSGVSGPVRLSGAVNLSALADSGEIDFDCVFVTPL